MCRERAFCGAGQGGRQSEEIFFLRGGGRSPEMGGLPAGGQTSMFLRKLENPPKTNVTEQSTRNPPERGKIKGGLQQAGLAELPGRKRRPYTAIVDTSVSRYFFSKKFSKSCHRVFCTKGFRGAKVGGEVEGQADSPRRENLGGGVAMKSEQGFRRSRHSEGISGSHYWLSCCLKRDPSKGPKGNRKISLPNRVRGRKDTTGLGFERE